MDLAARREQLVKDLTLAQTRLAQVQNTVEALKAECNRLVGYIQALEEMSAPAPAPMNGVPVLEATE